MNPASGLLALGLRAVMLGGLLLAAMSPASAKIDRAKIGLSAALDPALPRGCSAGSPNKADHAGRTAWRCAGSTPMRPS